MLLLWINSHKQRYYKVVVTHDLFGEVCLIRLWGSLITDRGGCKSDIVQNDESLSLMIQSIKQQRQRRDYRLIIES